MPHFFLVYDPATGAAKRSGFCMLAAGVAPQARPGEAVIATDRLYLADKVKLDVTKSPPAIVAI